MVQLSIGRFVGAVVLAVSVAACGSGGDGADQITSPPNEDASFVFCRIVPIWVAYQDGTGPWTRATAGSNNTFSVPIRSRAGVAFVWSGTGGYNVIVIYATASELTRIGRRVDPSCPRSGTKVLHGTVAGVGGAEEARVVLGGAGATLSGGQTSYTLDRVLDGRFDLFAARRSRPGSAVTTSKVIVRRGLDLPAGSSIPVLDFNGAEAVDATQGTLMIGGLRADLLVLNVSFAIDTNPSVLLTQHFRVNEPAYGYQGVPSSIQPDDALHSIRVQADPPVGDFGTNTRTLLAYFRTAGDRTVTLGPPLATGTITPVPGSDSPRRYRVQVPVQSEYSTEFAATILQSGSGRGVWISATAGYFGGVPGSVWDLSIPDLSAAGFDPDWGLSTAAQTTWWATAYGGAYSGGITDVEAPFRDGATVLSATRFGGPVDLSSADRSVLLRENPR